MRKTYLFLTVLMLILFSMKQNAQVLPSDSLALVAFYNASGGDWDNTGTWLVDSVSKWAGIVVTGDRVTEINTEGFFPSGTIAPELGNLSELKVLKLIGLETGPVIADFNGSIPPEIWNLTNLEKLQIKFTNVTGGIPAGISSMDSLQEINFQQTYLEGTIPAELFELPSLTKAYLHQSNFTGTVPSTVTGATALTRLYLHDNKLEGPLPFVDLPDGQAKVTLTGNYFTFADVKQYHDSAATFAGFTDDYQFAQDTMFYADIDEGSSLTFDLYVPDGEAYAWFKGVEPTPISTDTSYTLDPVALTDTGTYVCKVQNASVTNFDIRAAFVVENIIALPASPVFQSAYSSTDGTLINVDFDLDLADASGEAGSFTVNIDGSPVTVSAAATDGTDASIVALTLSTAVPNSTAVITVSYTPGTLQSTEGGMVAAFGPESVTNNVPTGIENVETNFTVYPNPFTNTIRISSASKITYVGIFDISGNMIREFSASENTLVIQVDELNNGVYFLNIKSEDSSSIRKLIKQ